jgi:hypothetical protein
VAVAFPTPPAADSAVVAAADIPAAVAEAIAKRADYFRARTQSTAFAIEFAGRMPRHAMLG